MSKIKFLLFLLVTFQIFSYDYYKEINLSGEEDYKELYITEDIYSRSKNDLSDIRIISDDGKEIAYVIERSVQKNNFTEKIISFGEIISNINRERTTETIIKFISQNSLEDIIGNRLEIEPIKNFYSEYKLLGSNNGKNWEIITSGEIYKTPEKERLFINFPANRYTYYKIITPLSEEKIIRGAILKLNVNKKEDEKNKNIKLNFTQEEIDKKSLLIIESKNLPLERLKIVAHGEFKRNYYLNTNYLSGTIFKVGKKEKLTIEFKNIVRAEKLFLNIENGDSNPIKINEIIGEYPLEKIMFKADKGRQYRITFGDDSLSKPYYDLVEFNNLIEKRDIITAGELKFKENKVIVNSTDYSIYYNIFIGVVVILLIIFMFKKFSKK